MDIKFILPSSELNVRSLLQIKKEPFGSDFNCSSCFKWWRLGASHLSIQKNRGKEKSYLYFFELHIRFNTPNSQNCLTDYVSGMLKLRIFQYPQSKICLR